MLYVVLEWLSDGVLLLDISCEVSLDYQQAKQTSLLYSKKKGENFKETLVLNSIAAIA